MLGIIIALSLYATHHGIRIIVLFDRFSLSTALGAAMVRLGNFFNSEIVGRATDLPWGMRFVRYDRGQVARHPTQLYESALGFCVLAALFIADRWAGKEKRPPGLLTGLFFTLYCGGRFVIEFYKEPLVLYNSPLTMGQYLSIPPFFCGVVILIRSLRNSTG
jgi:prolipoprotein diacylglyceryl transferase